MADLHDGAPRRVLIVDDNRELVASFAALLAGAGHTVFTAYDGAEAIECAAHARPDVVILDVHMPRLRGDTVARVLRRHPEMTRPILIGITGLASAEVRTAQCDGFDAMLCKPIDVDALLRIVTSTDVVAAPLRTEYGAEARAKPTTQMDRS